MDRQESMRRDTAWGRYLTSCTHIGWGPPDSKAALQKRTWWFWWAPCQTCLKRGGLRGDLNSAYKYLMGGNKDGKLFPAVSSDRKEAIGTNWNMRNSTWKKKFFFFFFWECCPTPDQVDQKVSMLWDIQNSTGQCQEQPCSRWPHFQRGSWTRRSPEFTSYLTCSIIFLI